LERIDQVGQLFDFGGEQHKRMVVGHNSC
jgi:hypothetical protein